MFFFPLQSLLKLRSRSRCGRRQRRLTRLPLGRRVSVAINQRLVFELSPPHFPSPHQWHGLHDPFWVSLNHTAYKILFFENCIYETQTCKIWRSLARLTTRWLEMDYAKSRSKLLIKYRRTATRRSNTKKCGLFKSLHFNKDVRKPWQQRLFLLSGQSSHYRLWIDIFLHRKEAFTKPLWFECCGWSFSTPRTELWRGGPPIICHVRSQKLGSR